MWAAGLFFLLFVYVGGHGNYFGIWLRDEAGWSEAAIGWQGGIHYACLIVFPLLWGHRIDRGGDPGRVVRLIATASVVAFLPFVLTTSVLPLLLATFAFGAFRVGMITSGDSLTLAQVQQSGGDYGRVRIWGSVGFIVGGFAMATVVSAAGRGAIPLALLGVLVLTAGLSSLLPGRFVTASKSTESLPSGLRRLLRRPELRRFFLITLGARLFSQGLYIFLPLHLKDLGVAEPDIPLYWAVGVASEIVLMGNAPRLFGRFSMRSLLSMCLALGALQYTLLVVVEAPSWLYGVLLLHGMSFGIWYYASVTWLGSAVEPTERASAQGLFQSVGFGVGGTLSAVGCGYLYEIAGGPTMFAVAAVGMAALTVAAARGSLDPGAA